MRRGRKRKEASGEQPIFDALHDFIAAESWTESKDVLIAHPELLTDDAEAMLVANIGSWPGDDSEIEVLEKYLNVLRSSRLLGIAATFDNLASTATDPAEDLPPALMGSFQRLGVLYARAHQDPGLYVRVVSLGTGVLQRLGNERYASHRSTVLGLIGDAYLQMATGDRIANLNRAMKCFRQALELQDRDRAPARYAATLNSLGIAYRRLPTGDRAANVERATTCFEMALWIYPADAPRYTYAEIQHNLGNAFLDLRSRDRSANVEQAIACFQDALRVFDPRTAPREHAQAQSSLGLALSSRTAGDRLANLRQAIECFEIALQFFRPETAPMDYARTQYNLGIRYADLGQRYSDLTAPSRAADFRKAIACYTEALRYWTQEVTPWDYADVQNSFGIALVELASADSTLGLEGAAACFEEAARIKTAQAAPAEHRRAAGNLGNLHFGQAAWGAAHAAYASAIAAGELLYKVSATEASRQAELAETIDVIPNDAYCLARLGKLAEAAERLEGGRARLLADVLSREQAALEEAHLDDREAFGTVREQIAALEAEARGAEEGSSQEPDGRSFADLSTDLAEARGELSKIIERIRSYIPAFMAEGMPYREIVGIAAPTRPVVYLVTTTNGSLALIVPSGGSESADCALWLDGFSAASLARLRREDERGEVAGGLLMALVRRDPDRLAVALRRTLPILREQLMQPLAARLATLGFSEATVIPGGALSLLALPAAAPEGFIVALAPSARALQTGSEAPTERTTRPGPVLLAVGNPLPLPEGMESLAFARAEVQAIGTMFGGDSHVLVEVAATRTAVLSSLEGASHLHLACHGSFDFDEPLDSGLWLSLGETLTLRDLVDGELDLSSVRLAVLSACESGLTEFRELPDEAIGLPAGFHQAGVPGVVGTLWPVNDVSTAVLMAEFYRLALRDGLDPARALHGAQRYLRGSTAEQLDLAGWFEGAYENSGDIDRSALDAASYYRANPNERPFEDPIFWAGFVFSGQ